MRIVDPSNLQPYVLVPLSPEEYRETVDVSNYHRTRTSHTPLTPEQEANLVDRVATNRADRAWLAANAPVGAVFDHLGVTHMVVRIWNGCSSGSLGPKQWQVDVHRPDGQGSITVEALTVDQLRARIEPGFVA